MVSFSLQLTGKRDSRLCTIMPLHYTQPKGFVGRSICYAIVCNGNYFGHIVGGSSIKYLPGRDAFFGMEDKSQLNNIINNTFFHVIKPIAYPFRNFVPFVLDVFEKKVKREWEKKYGDIVIGFESLVELPRTGECYRRASWTLVGQTKGFTCKREAGKGTDSWSGKRVWDTDNLRPKLVFCKAI